MRGYTMIAGLLAALLALLVGCAAETVDEDAPLPLEAGRPTFAFFYTDN